MRKVLFIVISILSCTFVDAQPLISKQHESAKSCCSDEERVVTEFLNWYKTNYELVNSFDLVKMVPDEPYEVDTLGYNQYLTFLSDSGFLSSVYIDTWRRYFVGKAEQLRLNPESDGPPSGFDYDFILLTQEMDTAIDAIAHLKIYSTYKITENHTQVCVDLDVQRLVFILSRVGSKWLIDSIEVDILAYIY